jgi:hypothetical protein
VLAPCGLFDSGIMDERSRLHGMDDTQISHVAPHATGDMPVRTQSHAYGWKVCGWVILAAVCAAFLWAVLEAVLGLPHPSAARVEHLLELRAPPGSRQWVDDCTTAAWSGRERCE